MGMENSTTLSYPRDSGLAIEVFNFDYAFEFLKDRIKR